MYKVKKLKQSKKRDKKVYITDIAIKKVPYIKYKGLTEEQNKVLHQLAREVLILSSRENNSNEVAITWDITSDNPDMYGIAYGSEHTVDVSTDTLSFHLLYSPGEGSIVMLHNHPSTRTFSLEDIFFMLQFAKLCYLVVVSNQGTIHYIRKEKNYNVKKAGLLYNECVSRMKKAQTVEQLYGASVEFLSRCKEVGLYYE